MLLLLFLSYFTQETLLSTQITFISEWTSNHVPSDVCDEITYPSPNVNSAAVEVWEWLVISAHIYRCNYLSILGFKLNHV